MQDKVEGVVEAPIPQNVSKLRAFLGTINYYGPFISDLSTLLPPLNNLLKSGVEWEWSAKWQAAFSEVKKWLCSAPVLAHYNPRVPLILATDASPCRVAAVLSHRFSDGSERPIAFASYTASEKNYSQIDREALSNSLMGLRNFIPLWTEIYSCH